MDNEMSWSHWNRLLLAAALALHGGSGFSADPSDDVFDKDDLRVQIAADLPYVEVDHEGETVTIMRHQDPGHTIDSPFDRTARACPPFCIHPMNLAPGVETIGGLEIIDYLKRVSAGDDSVMVIDSRVEEQAKQGTIPGSVNIPFTRLDRGSVPPQEIAELLALEFGAVQANGLWDFSTARTLVLFCNGAWCGQSPTNIRALLALGYPPHKLKWYRGGMQAWEQFGLTTVGD